MAISFDNAANSTVNLSASSITDAFTVGSGSNRYLICNVIGDATSDLITGVTYAGVAMTRLWALNPGGSGTRWHYVYYLANPASGTNNIVVSASTAIVMGVTPWSGAGVGGVRTYNGNSASGPVTSITTSATTSDANSWVVVCDCPGSGSDSETGYTQRGYDATFGSMAIGDSNGTVTVGSHSFTHGFSAADAVTQVLVVLYPYLPPGPVLGGAWKRSGLPTVKKNHFIRQKLLAFWIDTGMGFYWDAMGNFPPYPGPVNSGYSADAAIPYNKTLPTPYGAAQIWQGNSFPGFVQPGPCAIYDTTILATDPITVANELHNQGVGAGYSIVCGFMHTGEALTNVTTGGSPVSGWIFGRTNHAVETTPWMNCGFYKTYNDQTTIGCGVATGTSSSNWAPLTVGTFTSTPYEYTVCGLSCLNTSVSGGVATGVATFYAQGNEIASQSGYSFVGSEVSNDSEGQIQFGLVFHTSTGESQCPMDGSVYWGVFCKGALTAAEQAYFAWPGMLNDALDWGGGEDVVYNAGGSTVALLALLGFQLKSKGAPAGVVPLLGRDTIAVKSRAQAGAMAALAAKVALQAKGAGAPIGSAALSGRSAMATKGRASAAGGAALKATLTAIAKAQTSPAGKVGLAGLAAFKAVGRGPVQAVAALVALLGAGASQFKSVARLSATSNLVALLGTGASQFKGSGKLTGAVGLSGRAAFAGKLQAGQRAAAALAGTMVFLAKGRASAQGAAALAARLTAAVGARGTLSGAVNLVALAGVAAIRVTGRAALSGVVGISARGAFVLKSRASLAAGGLFVLGRYLKNVTVRVRSLMNDHVRVRSLDNDRTRD